jgi:hypothetical protein
LCLLLFYYLDSKDREGEGRPVYAYKFKDVCDLCKTSVHITLDTQKVGYDSRNYIDVLIFVSYTSLHQSPSFSHAIAATNYFWSTELSSHGRISYKNWITSTCSSYSPISQYLSAKPLTISLYIFKPKCLAITNFQN